MTERDLITHVASVSGSGVSRRGFLTAGALATLGASTLLAACSSDKKSDNADKSSKPVKTGPNAFQGVTLNVGCNPTGVQPAQAAGALWAAKTGGKVNAVVIPYAERATDYATMIVSKDPHYDVLFGSVDFVSNFGDRIYDDLGDLGGITKDLIPAALNQLKKGGKLYAAPLFADMEFFIYNKQDWKDAGLDPEKVPTTWSELYDLAPKLNTGGRAANVTPWNTIGVPYWISMYNSLGGQMFNDDKTEVLFDNDKALKTWQTVEDGFKKQFFGIAAANATGDADTQLLFNQNLGASEINTAGFWSQVLGSDPAFKLKIKKEDVGVVIMPGIDSGTSGSVIVAEGLGVNKFGKNKDAALDFVKYTVSPDFQKQLVLGKAGTVLPTSSISVSGDKDVAASFPIAPLLAEQSKHQLTWPGNAPFNWNAPFLLGLTNISKGTWDAAKAQSETVKAVKKLVVDYIASN
jgi:multiple sugar transport system substrate-binding protein